MFGLTHVQILILIGAAIIIGFSKTGITGATLPAVAMVANIFGGKLSSGIMLTALIAADLPAIYNYGKYGRFKDIIKVLPPAVAGIILGAIVGRYLNDDQFKLLMGIIVIASIVILVYREVTNKNLKIPNSKWFHTMVGIVAGFTSMVGNAAGPIMAVYMMSLSFEKNRFIATAAWFFFIVNLIKVPFHIVLWETISWETLKYTGLMIPFILLGALIGIRFVKKIDEKVFKTLVILVTAIAALRLII